MNLLFFPEEVNHQFIKFEFFSKPFFEELDSIIFLIFDWNQAWKKAGLRLDSFSKEINDGHKITEAIEISGDFDLGKVLDLDVEELLWCEILTIGLIDNFFFTDGDVVLGLDFSLALHDIEHGFLVFFFIFFLWERFVERDIFELFPACEVRDEVIMTGEEEPIRNKVLLFGDEFEGNAFKDVLFGVEIGTGFAEPVSVGRKVLSVALLEEQLFHWDLLMRNGVNRCQS